MNKQVKELQNLFSWAELYKATFKTVEYNRTQKEIEELRVKMFKKK